MANIFVSYSFDDSRIAQGFKGILANQFGHDVFLAEDRDAIKIGEEWSKKITESIDGSEYFIILLSESSIVSEFVVEELNYAIELKSKSPESKPYIIPIRLNLPFETKFDYNLSSRISRFQYRMWKDENDTKVISEEIISIINEKNYNQVYTNDTIPILSDGKIPVAKINPDYNLPEVDEHYNLKRIYDDILLIKLQREESLLKIKGPSQYGKGMVLKCFLKKVKALDYKIILIDFNIWSCQDFSNIDSFFKKFAQECYYRLTRDRDYTVLNEFWENGNFTPRDKMTNFMLQYLLNDEKNLLLAINDIDLLYPFENSANSFCALLRYWYNESGQFDSEFEHLKIAITYSSDTVEAITSENESPFNVGGDPVEIQPFNQEEVKALSLKYDETIAEPQIQYLFETFGGHPYLTKKALSKIYVEMLSFENLESDLISTRSPFHDHLKKITHLIISNDLTGAIKKLIRKLSIDVEEFFKLSSLGIITGNRNEEKWSNGLYEKHFRANF